MKIAVCGNAPSVREAPWYDPSWTKWALPWGHHYIEQADRLFEIHRPLCMGGNYPAKIELLRRGGKVILQDGYPLREVIKDFRDFFYCSIDYMLAQAVKEGPEELGLWGVNGMDAGYQHQKESISFWLGVAIGRGIKLTLPPDCDLLKYTKPDCILHDWPERYGYLPENERKVLT